jgi:hypothetical protein
MAAWERAKHWKMRNGMRVKWKYSYMDDRVGEARNYEMPNRMRVKGKHSYLDDSVEEG